MADIYKLDDYRKTPRGPVQHEIAMDPHAARHMREDAERLEAYKAAMAVAMDLANREEGQ